MRRTGFDGSRINNQVAPGDSDFNYGLNGQASVPEATLTHNQGGAGAGGGGGNRQSTTTSNGGNNNIHPHHVQRTAEFREQAALMRQQ